MNGYFITFEGPDGAGKTTIIDEIIKTIKDQVIAPIKVTREPGGSTISENIRQIILDPDNDKMNNRTEALLYAAARSQHIFEVIKPELEAGNIVFSDRFVDSSLAYQGVGRNLGIDEVKSINDFATNSLKPVLTLFFDIDPKQGLLRIKKARAGHEDRLELEKLAFHQKVYQGYQTLFAQESDRIKVVDARLSIPEVTLQSVKIIRKQLPEIFK